MSQGTALPAVIERIQTLFNARTGGLWPILDERPASPAETLAADGKPGYVFLAETVTQSWDNVVFMGGRLTIDETFVLPWTIEVALSNSGMSDTRERAGEILHELLAAICVEPMLGFEDTAECQFIQIYPSAGEYQSGALADTANVRAVRHIVNLTVVARLTLI